MSLFSSRILPFTRNLSCKLFKPNFGNQAVAVRSYWRRRGDGFSELSSLMQSMENYMREMDREMNRVFGDIQRLSPVKIPRLSSPFEWGRMREIPVLTADGDGKNYKLELDMKGMEPENIKIHLKDNELTISARQDTVKEDGSRMVRENSYHYTLPQEINPDTIRSTLKDGILTIEAPLPALEEKEIPVKIEGQKDSGSDSSSDSKK